MSLRGGGKTVVASSINNLSKGKNEEVQNPMIEHLNHGVSDINLDAQDGGDWEVISRKSKNRAGSSAAKPWNSQNSGTKAWGHPDTVQKLNMQSDGGSGRVPGNAWATQTVDPRRSTGRGNARPQPFNRGLENNYVAPQPVIRPPLERGWNWSARVGAAPTSLQEPVSNRVDDADVNHNKFDDGHAEDDDNDDNDDDGALDETDDELLSEDFDSDESEKSHESRKKNKWFKKFFENLDSLTVEEIGDPARQWHCPACQGGPGAIDWYRGLQPLMTHAKTKGSKRVKLHRELAELLDEELYRRGTSVIPAGEVFGRWKGFEDEEKDHEIVWPPMVIVMNTRLEQDENDKWVGMGNQELLDYFSSYAAVRARHSYGPQGHRGMSVLIFESSATGYLEADRLHKHFTEEGTDRNAWNSSRRVLFYPGGKRQLYGFMALYKDLEAFNQHSQGRSKLKYEMKSYHDMVLKQLRQMREDNEQLVYWKDKVARQKMHSKALEESFGIVTEKLRMTMEENRIVRQRTQIHHEQNKEELDFQEQFFKEQIRIIRVEMEAKEEEFEKVQQDEREKVKQLNADPANTEDYRHRVEKVDKFIKIQNKEMEDFAVERDKLMKEHEDEMAAMTRRHWEEKIQLEKQFDENLTSLMKKYSPHDAEGTSSH
ncbi:hypothetical protein K2173_000927 [Erythroxylum novogranatense]|uniref:Uncharacterized protein n=1 Tax=Erythroxylum novogranatense TaxID=1862640 RepID=A0AAV8TQE4_9ROSI|nr:hypothetical protein K2173_000927 [Erythroxylum novogranatense]